MHPSSSVLTAMTVAAKGMAVLFLCTVTSVATGMTCFRRGATREEVVSYVAEVPRDTDQITDEDSFGQALTALST